MQTRANRVCVFERESDDSLWLPSGSHRYPLYNRIATRIKTPVLFCGRCTYVQSK